MFHANCLVGPHSDEEGLAQLQLKRALKTARGAGELRVLLICFFPMLWIRLLAAAH